jgi:ribonuclease-3 family protein
VNTVPHGATPGQYHAATALEAVFGWLWLRGERERIHELFAHITEDYDAA